MDAKNIQKLDAFWESRHALKLNPCFGTGSILKLVKICKADNVKCSVFDPERLFPDLNSTLKVISNPTSVPFLDLRQNQNF